MPAVFQSPRRSCFHHDVEVIRDEQTDLRGFGRGCCDRPRPRRRGFARDCGGRGRLAKPNARVTPTRRCCPAGSGTCTTRTGRCRRWSRRARRSATWRRRAVGRGRPVRRQGHVQVAQRARQGRHLPRAGRVHGAATGPTAGSARRTSSATSSSTWSSPPRPRSRARARAAGTTAINIYGRYEIQVLDSFDNPTYADGQCGAIYGQRPPLVNASQAAGRVADLRHRLGGPALGRVGQADEEGLRDRPAERPAPAQPPGADRHDAVPPARQLRQAPPAEGPDRAVLPRQPGPLPQHLDPARSSCRSRTDRGVPT